MIEINLLPDDKKRPEGPPPARLGAVSAGVLVACAALVLVLYYKMGLIPKKESEIRIQKDVIVDLNLKLDIVNGIEAERTRLNTKLATLTSLLGDRIPYARLLDTLCDAVDRVPGAWFSTFSVGPDSSPAPAQIGMVGTPGKRYMVNLTGYTTGATALEMDQKLKDLINSLSYHFIKREDRVDDKGFNKFIGASFDQPKLSAKSSTTLPAPDNVKDPKQLKAINAPTEGLNFQMTLSFSLAPKQQ